MLTSCSKAQDDVKTEAQAPAPTRTEYSPNLDADYPQNVYFGDTHLHTSYSFDAGMVGNSLGPDAAYKFAKGEIVTASLGARAKLDRPLDFLVIADHAESLGLAPMIAEDNPIVMSDPQGRELYDLVKSGGDPVAPYVKFAAIKATTSIPPMHRDDVRQDMWGRIVDSAEAHNQPGKFTALIGYEYTSSNKTNNLHRVVVFRDGADKLRDILPFSSVESLDPEDLWAFLETYEKNTGGQAMAIPHNGNLSNGTMFDDVKFDGSKLDMDYASRRARWEPLYEVTQIKGDGEAHPILSPNDEFADFWTWDRGNFGFAAKTDDMLPREYAREALKRGLEYEDALGTNPFKFGMIGASDSHTSLATTREDNFFSKASPAEPNSGDFRYEGAIVQKYPGHDVDVREYSYETAAAGLAGVWAKDNTREALFDAMARKEVYATTGSRIRLRMFAGDTFEPEDVFAPNLARVGYNKGVPMGGNLSADDITDAPKFLIQAQRDPDGANLDRIQVVKGWLDGNGRLLEEIYNVAWSPDRARLMDQSVDKIPSTVNGATYNNSVGEPELRAVWRDPEFKASERAFYYVRVLEIPTPTWLAYDKAFYGEKIELPKDAKLSHQERAYSSPIWYSPQSK